MDYTALITAVAGLITAIGGVIYALKNHKTNAARIDTLEKGAANGPSNVGASTNVDSHPSGSLFSH
jgi:hypothetical protein